MQDLFSSVVFFTTGGASAIDVIHDIVLETRRVKMRPFWKKANNAKPEW
jgi:hypothetical protein